jgi:hypothetical protein
MNKSEKLINDLGMQVVKLCIVLGIMFLFRFLVSKVLVLDKNEFFSTGLTVMDVAIGAVNAIILVFLMKFGLHLDRNYEVINFPKAMKIGKWIVILSTSIVAYKIYYRIAKHILRRREIDSYHVGFLIISLLILARLAVLLFTNMEKITDLFVGKIKLVLREPVPEIDDETPEEPKPTCAGCGRPFEKDVVFCSQCGKKVA